jgi:predicted O-linked N-acetylglucosamine transferase (SPINDLY family)
MIVKAPALRDLSTGERIHSVFEQNGVARERVELVGLDQHREHMGSYSRIDIALDTFPYHGTTTTCEALWMGVPVVTMAGRRHVSRVSASLLTAAGLPDLIATSPEEYAAIAVELAKDPARVCQLRRTMRARLTQSPLMDEKGFARDWAAAMRQIWREWCSRRQS